MKQRADVALVERGLAESRTRAQALIMAGLVYCGEQRINKPGAIQVSVESLRVTVDGDTATAKFRQHYKSATLKTSSNKILQLGKRDGKWLILQERVGN